MKLEKCREEIRVRSWYQNFFCHLLLAETLFVLLGLIPIMKHLNTRTHLFPNTSQVYFFNFLYKVQFRATKTFWL